MARTDREPCPWRIVEDAGGAFAFGLVGGTIWHGFGGARNAPKKQRIAGAIHRIQTRAPITGGSFAVWGTIFSCFDCTLTYYRKKEDPWNAIISGAATGGLLAARAGLKAMGRNAVAGGVILAAIEGVSLLVTRVVMPAIEKQFQEDATNATVVKKKDKLLPPVDPARKLPRYRSSISRGRQGGDSFLDDLSKQTTTQYSSSSTTSSSSEQGFVTKSSSPENQPTPKSTSTWKLW